VPRKTWRAVLALILGAGVLGPAAMACGAHELSPASRAGQGLTWGPCEGVSSTPSPRFECATLQVPLDYARPDGEKIGIALVRVPATGPGERLGSLVFNFGGPGGSGVTTLMNAAFAFRALNRRYDLVSFDPRGVDRSSGIRCLDGPRMDWYLAHEPSDDIAEETRLITEFAQGCERNAGRILPYVGTVNVARDMERLRQALGEPRLNYFGFSYGTHLGAVYATLYPDKVGRMVLDSAVDPTVGLLEMARTQALGFQKAYEQYLAGCVKSAEGCPLGADAEQADKTVRTLLDRLKRAPVKVGDRLVTEDIARIAIAHALYSDQSWPLLTEALRDADKGDMSGLLTLADDYASRRPDGTYASLHFALPAVLCADTTDRPSVAQAEALARELRAKTPIFAETAVSAGACSVWPVPGNDEARRIDATGSPPILVIGVTNDPATPYQWAPRLARLLRTGVLLTLEGEGHGAYGRSRCIDSAVNAYLLEGKVPQNGLRCRE